MHQRVDLQLGVFKRVRRRFLHLPVDHLTDPGVQTHLQGNELRLERTSKIQDFLYFFIYNKKIDASVTDEVLAPSGFFHASKLNEQLKNVVPLFLYATVTGRTIKCSSTRWQQMASKTKKKAQSC